MRNENNNRSVSYDEELLTELREQKDLLARMYENLFRAYENAIIEQKKQEVKHEPEIRGDRRIPRMRTLPKAVAEIRSADPESQFSLPMLRKMVSRGIIECVTMGNYKLIDFDKLLDIFQNGENCFLKNDAKES